MTHRRHFLSGWPEKHRNIRMQAVDRRILISKGGIAFVKIEDRKRCETCAKQLSTRPLGDNTNSMSVDDIMFDMMREGGPTGFACVSKVYDEFRSIRTNAHSNSRVLCFLMGHTDGVGDGSWLVDGNHTIPIIERFTVCCFLCHPIEMARKVVVYDPRRNTPRTERPGLLIDQFITKLGNDFRYLVMYINGFLKSNNCSQEVMYDKCVSFLHKCATFADPIYHRSFMEKLDSVYIIFEGTQHRYDGGDDSDSTSSIGGDSDYEDDEDDYKIAHVLRNTM